MYSFYQINLALLTVSAAHLMQIAFLNFAHVLLKNANYIESKIGYEPLSYKIRISVIWVYMS